MSNKPEWADVGFDGLPDNSSNQRGPFRFWMKHNEEKKVVFVDDNPFRVYEHQMYAFGNWNNHRTCTQGISGSCPLCDAKINKYYAGFLTIIDRTEYVNQSGRVVKDVKKLLVCKTDTLNMLKRKKESNQGLAGKGFTVFRTAGQKSPTVGNDWECSGPVDLAGFREKDKEGKDLGPVTAYNYAEILKPKSISELQTFLKSVDLRKTNERTERTAPGAAPAGPAPTASDNTPVPY